MKHYGKKALSLVMSLLMLASLLVSTMMWVAADANTTTLIGFDEENAASLLYLEGGNGTPAIIDYDGGKAMQYAGGTWGNLYVTMANTAQVDATAIAFKVSVPAASLWAPFLCETDVNGNILEVHRPLAAGSQYTAAAPITLIAADGTVSEIDLAQAANPRAPLPANFTGWVIYPFSVFQEHSAWHSSANNVVDYTQIRKVMMCYETNNSTIDEIVAVTDVNAFINGDSEEEEPVDANTNTLIGFNEDGALGQVSLDGMGNGTLSVVDYDGGKALQYANGTWGYPTIRLFNRAGADTTAIALKVSAPVATGWNVLLLEQDEHGNTLEGYSLKAGGKVTLVDTAGVATEVEIDNAANLFPDGFTGWVILTADSLTRHPGYGEFNGVVDFASVGKIMMQYETNGTNIVDDIVSVVDVDAFVETLLPPNTKNLIGFDEDGALSKVDLGGMGNGTLSVIDYDGGKALQYANGTWGYPTISLFNKASAAATAIALKVSAPVATGWAPVLFEMDAAGNTLEAYILKAGGKVTLIDAAGVMSELAITSTSNLFPNGFTGTVILTADSLAKHPGYSYVNNNAVDFDLVGKIMMQYETNGTNIVDEIFAIIDLNKYLGITPCAHEYDNACDVDCNLCGEAREVEHNVIAVEAKAATCTENGNIAYWYCDVCGQAWLDEACTLNTNLLAVVLPAAHNYVDGVCSVCGAKDGWVDGCYYVNGEAVKGLYQVDGAYYYFNTGSGKMMADKTIWVKADNGYGLAAGHYVLGTDGKLQVVKNGWLTNDKGQTFYYINDERVKGLYEIDGDYYYFNTGSGLLTVSKTIWVAKSNTYGLAAGNYELGADGKLVVPVLNGWVGNYYYVDGEAVKGVYEIDGEYYYFHHASGVLQVSKTVWIKADNACGLAAGNYELTADGVIVL